MANIATGYLEIIFDKNSELNKNTVDEIMSTIENNNHFTYGGDCEGFLIRKRDQLILFLHADGQASMLLKWVILTLITKEINFISIP